MKKILSILIIIMLGLNIFQYVSRETLPPKIITRVIYKDRIINKYNNVYQTKIVYKQTEKQKNDLQILIKIDNRMREYFNTVGNNDWHDYNEDKKMEQGTKTDYEFDIFYLESSIKMNTKH